MGIVNLHGVLGLLLQVLGGEVRRVDLGRQPRLERRAEAPQVVEVDAREEGVLFDFLGAGSAEAGFGAADEAEGMGIRDMCVMGG